MTPQGNIADLVRNLGVEALKRELEAMGLPPRGVRARCPFPGCAHKGRDRDFDAQLYGGAHPRIFCFACQTSGDIVDLIMLHRGGSRADAIAGLTANGLPPPRPDLRLVKPTPAPIDEPDKLSPAEVRRIWEAMALEDEAGQEYLRGRGLEEAVELGVLRFATEEHPNSKVKSLARRRYRVAALISDVVGNHRGIQVRMVGEPTGRTPKVLSVTGSSTRGFFGRPELIEDSPIIAVTEGIADTAAVSAWARERPGVCVVGTGGKGRIPHLAEALNEAGVDVAGKYFLLCVQNDRPRNESRKYFLQLAQQLKRMGAHPVFFNPPDEYKDVAELLQHQPDLEWPPAALQRAILPEPGGDIVEERAVVPAGAAVAVPARITAELYAQNFTTLCALLDDPVTRESVFGRDGELSWCEMRQAPRFEGRPLVDTDYLAIRLGLETQTRSTDGKPLKFSLDDITQAVTLIARRKTVHPVREWLTGLQWDGHHRLDVELPQLLGHPPGSFEGVLLRRWCIAAVARAMTPGCKVDTVLILIGRQGSGKSRFFETLGGEWFTSDKVLVDDRDSKLVMRRAWIIEWAELDAMRRARDQEAIKAFISQRVDQFRPPYGREVIEVPRSSILGGTTNDRSFLHDPTGSRRFFSVEVLQPIDIAWLQAHREQLFAEALARFRRGEQWWLTPEEDAELADRNTDFESSDTWADAISDWLADNSFVTSVTTSQLLAQAIGKDLDMHTRHDEMRVSAILKRLGWRGPRRQREGSTVRRVYDRP